ncbi:disulfide reductase, partial [Candidatus Bathyarchaeota archaeon]|nr:disulfide reductase [Candidatus Bathyarchaeota archaeon]
MEQEPRVGVFICSCGTNIGGVVNVPEVAEYAKTIPHVIHTEHNMYTCSEAGLTAIQESIKEHNLNRVVVASCTPRTHEPLF